MKLKEKTFIISLIFVSFLLIFNIQSYAGTQEWQALDYDVTVNSDGSMNVVETWNIKISETNTVFKDFDIDKSKYSEISNVLVTRIIDGEEQTLRQIYQEQYHVDSGCYYALPIGGNKFEIAWNVGLDNSTDTRTYKLYYTIKDAVKVYNDCTELYWMFLGTDNAISGENVTGTIKLPNQVTDIEKLRVWAHGDLSGNIERTSKNKVSFSIGKLDSRTMLEIRIVTEENIYTNCTNRINKNKLEEILAEEKQWADKANMIRNLVRAGVALAIAINIIGVYIVIRKIRKVKEEGKNLEEEYGYPEYDIKYFREIPNEENATPARAALLNNYTPIVNRVDISNDLSKIFSGTMLDFCLKGLIEFEPINEKDVKIILKEDKNAITLSEDEKIIYSILKAAIGTNNSITTKEFSKYSKRNYETVYTKLSNIQYTVEKDEIELGNIDKERQKIVEKMQGNQIISYVGLIFALFFMIAFMPLLVLLPIYIANIVLTIYKGKNVSKIKILTEKGYRESKEWQGLENYMNDYSLLKEKRVPDIVLWEKFLVYATTFGISKEVIKQLKLVHPEMFDPNENTGMYIGRYTYWNMVCNNRFSVDSFENLNKNLSNICNTATSAYNSAHSSSSGGGGGFSGGGGGRRRRWRLRRSLNLK